VLVTTACVVDETLTLLRLRPGLHPAEPWWQQVDGSQRLRWERVDASRFECAVELCFRSRDKAFSFMDCTTQPSRCFRSTATSSRTGAWRRSP
jgi:predicted nucleic acid-binding protein